MLWAWLSTKPALDMEEMLICEFCHCNINREGFVCQARLCPLDHFKPVGEIEIQEPGEPRRPRIHGRYFIFPEPIDFQKGGPAPSESKICHA